MACVALKRTSKFDSMFESPSKRARYTMPLHSVVVASSDCTTPFTELRRKVTPKKMTAPPTSLPQEVRGGRPSRQLKFDGVPPCRPLSELFVQGDKGEESKDQPLFTFSQLKVICELRLKEQEQSIREDYERILHDKLSEQYNTFVKFTHDQIMRGGHNPDTLLSYMS